MKRKISRGSASSKQTVYRLKNWSAYNKALIQRGSICVWLDEDVIAAWSYVGPNQRGAQFVYSNLAIQTALTFRKLFSLPLRQTQGFLQSLFDGMHLKLKVPDYSTLSRRQAGPEGDLRNELLCAQLSL